MNEPLLRIPPHSVEAEQSLLGALLLDNGAYETVSWLGTNAFYQDRHRRIWQGVSRMVEQGMAADVVTLAEYLGNDLEKAGGAAYLAALAQSTPSAINIRAYANLVHERYLQRTLAQTATEIAEQALSGGQDIVRLMDEAETRIFQIAENGARYAQGPRDLKPLLAQVFERIDHLYHRDGGSTVTGVPTGYVELDEKTSGLQRGDLIIIAGRPSMGKTALALNIAENIAVDCGLPVAIFSMEMSGTQLANRLLGSVGHIDQHRMRTGRLNDQEWSALTGAMEKLHGAPIQIDESGALTAFEVRSRARRIKRQQPQLGLIVIDYLQLMEAPASSENRATEISGITRTLKAMAKELEVPVIALSQLNRKVDERPDKRPQMADLRDSGAIEQDADLILFLYREAVYKQDLDEEARAFAELIIGKQRNGPIGTVPLTFLGQHTRFENYASVDGNGAWPTRRAVTKAIPKFRDFKTAASGADR